MTPEPLVRSSTGSLGACSSSSGSAYPVTKICTTLGLTRSARSCSDCESSVRPREGDGRGWAPWAASGAGIGRSIRAQSESVKFIQRL